MSDLALYFMSPAIICLVFVLLWVARFPTAFMEALKFNGTPVHISVISWAYVTTPVVFLLLLVNG